MSDEWRERAACREHIPALWFPSENGHRGGRVAARAKEICSGCEVRAACLQYALDRPEPFGIWGGLDPDERQKLRRRGKVAR